MGKRGHKTVATSLRTAPFVLLGALVFSVAFAAGYAAGTYSSGAYGDGAFGEGDTTPPTVSLDSPANSSTVSGNSVSLTATASDDIGVAGVQFKLDTNTAIGAEDTGSPYAVSWNSTFVADGSHTIVAVARDIAGNVATSTAATITVDNTAPVRSAGAPSNTLAVNTTSTTLSLTTNEAATCKYSTSSSDAYDSMTAFNTTGSTSHSTALSGLTNGSSYVYYVKCQDAQSNTNATNYTISFTVAADASSPTVSITAPTNNAVVSGNSVSLAADASDDVSVSGVQFVIDGNINIGSQITVAPYSTTWDSTNAADGDHTLVAVAVDGSNNHGTSSIITITVDNTAPSLSGGTPSGTLAAGTTAQTISLSTDENATCKYSTTASTAYGSMTSFTTTGGTNHSVLVTGLVSGSSNSYYVKCQDGQGNTNGSDYAITFDITADAPPTVSVSAPINNATVSGSISLSATASDDVGVAGVQFKLDTDTLVGSEDTGSPFSVSWNTASTSDGSHTLIAVARDTAGNYATSSAITITVRNTVVTSSGGGGSGGGGGGAIGGPLGVGYVNPNPTENIPKTGSLIPPTPAPTTPESPSQETAQSILNQVSPGESNDTVHALQEFLKDHGYLVIDVPTNFFGPLTKAALEKYQCDKGIVCDGSPETTGFGRVGPKTLAQLQVDQGTSSAPTPPSPPSVPSTNTGGTLDKPLFFDMTDPEVGVLQNFLIKNGYLKIDAATDYFGSLTKQAVRDFQCKENIACSDSADTSVWGYVGPATRAKINSLLQTE